MLEIRALFGVSVFCALAVQIEAQNRCELPFPFLCSNGWCILEAYACDGMDDCADGSDERSCQGCSQGSFSCGFPKKKPQCISASLVCDGHVDCVKDARDEDDCPDEDPESDDTSISYNSITILIYTGIALMAVMIGCVLLVLVRIYWKKTRKRQRPAASLGPGDYPLGSMVTMNTVIDHNPPSYETAISNIGFLPDVVNNTDRDVETVLQEPPSYESLYRNSTDAEFASECHVNLNLGTEDDDSKTPEQEMHARQEEGHTEQ